MNYDINHSGGKESTRKKALEAGMDFSQICVPNSLVCAGWCVLCSSGHLRFLCPPCQCRTPCVVKPCVSVSMRCLVGVSCVCDVLVSKPIISNCIQPIISTMTIINTLNRLFLRVPAPSGSRALWMIWGLLLVAASAFKPATRSELNSAVDLYPGNQPTLGPINA